MKYVKIHKYARILKNMHEKLATTIIAANSAKFSDGPPLTKREKLLYKYAYHVGAEDGISMVQKYLDHERMVEMPDRSYDLLDELKLRADTLEQDLEEYNGEHPSAVDEAIGRDNGNGQ